MTRLDPAGEPSMEDILASIRRIIAEDPPGSRPELPSAPRTPAAAAASPAPADPIREPVQPDPVFSSRPADLDFPRMSPTGKREAEAIPVARPSDAGNSSLDMQLADVLGTVRGAVAQSEARAPSAAEPNSSAAAVQAALDSLIPAKVEAPALEAAPVAPATPATPRFTFSRDGFDPARDNDVAAPEPVADPFEFSLGPSPFARAPANERAVPVKADRPADPFGSLVPSRDVLQVQAPSAPMPAPAPVEPPLSSLRAPFAPGEPTRPVFPEPAAPAPAAFIPAAPAPQGLGAPVARQEIPYRPLQAPSLGEIATAQPEAAAFAPVETSYKAAPSADFGLPVPPPAAPVVQPDVAVAAPVSAAPAAIVEAAPLPIEQPAAPAVAVEPIQAAEDPVAAILEQIAAAPVPVAVAPEPEPQPTPAVILEPAPAVVASVPEPAAPVHVEAPAPVAEETVALQPSADAAPEAQAVEAVFEDAHVPEPDPVPAPQPIEPEPQAVSQQALVNAHPAVQASTQDIATRSMEDTVAELLRPMLRNWLAENMPRIVERALRKELDESSRSEHKPAAE